VRKTAEKPARWLPKPPYPFAMCWLTTARRFQPYVTSLVSVERAYTALASIGVPAPRRALQYIIWVSTAGWG